MSKRENQFKADMPNIPGVSGSAGNARSEFPAGYGAMGLLAILLVAALGFWFVMRAKHAEPTASTSVPQIDVPLAASAATMPRADVAGANQTIAAVAEVTKPWAAKNFVYRDAVSGLSTPALLLRLPVGSAGSAAGYWAFAMNAAYGNCKLEYVTDLKKLADQYGYRGGKHHMIGNPCTQSLIDPLRMVSLPGSVWVRGAIVRGTDLRPPFAIEVKIKGKNVVAGRME